MTMAFAFFTTFVNRTKNIIDWTDAYIGTTSKKVFINFFNGERFTDEMLNEFKTFLDLTKVYDSLYDSKRFPDGSKFSVEIRFDKEEEEEEEEE